MILKAANGKKVLEQHDCRDSKYFDYERPNVMNDHRFFNFSKYKLEYKLCESADSNKISNHVKLQNQCNQNDKVVKVNLLARKYSDLEWLIDYEKNQKTSNNKSGSQLYIAYSERKAANIPPSLSPEQFSTILYPNDFNRPEVLRYAQGAKNAYRNRFLKRDDFDGCR